MKQVFPFGGRINTKDKLRIFRFLQEVLCLCRKLKWAATSKSKFYLFHHLWKRVEDLEYSFEEERGKKL